MRATPLTLGRRYGSLVVARIQPDGLIFCNCDCGGSREVRRASLTTRSIRQCRTCGIAARQHKQKPRRDEPVQELVKIELPKCTGRREGGFLLCGPDCPRHPLGGINLGWPPRREREAIIGWVE